MKDIKEFIMNHKVLSIIVGLLLVIVLASSCSNEDVVKDGYNDATQEVTQDDNQNEPKEVVEEPQTQEDYGDGYVNNNPIPQSNNIEDAYTLLKPLVEESFNRVRYEYTIVEGTLVLKIHISDDELAIASLDEWNEIVDNAVYAGGNSKQVLEANGYTNINFSIWVGDFDRDNFHLMTINDNVMYDSINGINRIN